MSCIKQGFCSAVCIPGFKECKCDFFHGCHNCGWDNCRWRNHDDACELKNKACKGLREGPGKLLDQKLKAADAAGQKLVEATKKLTDVKKGVQGSIDMFNRITTAGFGGLLDIQEINFESSLAVAALGKYSLSVRAVILGQSQTLDINADLYAITSTIVNPLAKKIGIKV